MQFHKKISEFYQTRPLAKKILFYADKISTALVFLAYLIGFLLLVIKKTPLLSSCFMVFLLCPFSALICVSLFRFLCKRKRPYENGVVPLFEKHKTGNSFPSRHSASAFSIGVSLLPVCLPCAIVALVSGVAFLYTRTVLGWHYPSDLLAGSVLGGIFGSLNFLF